VTLRFAVLVPAPDFPEPWGWAFDVEAAVLAGSGAAVDAIPWTEAGDLRGYDLILPLVAWGYHLRYAEWLEFLGRLERDDLPVVNPAPLLRWNSDKSYLTELTGKGVATVPTIFVEACDDDHLAAARDSFATERLVVKPPVSGGATGTHLLGPADRLPADCRSRPTIIQPMVETIVTEGEYALMLFDNVLSHAVRKRPKAGDFRVQPHLGGTTVACAPPPGGAELAIAALAAAPASASYARVDMIRGEDGALMIMELELIEPALFLDLVADGGAAFVRAIAGAARSVKARTPSRKAS
jgi:glutathione synthase/RimK-type ligase-like ATP-grasp enzyme